MTMRYPAAGEHEQTESLDEALQRQAMALRASEKRYRDLYDHAEPTS